MEARFYCFCFLFNASASSCGSMGHVFPLSIFYSCLFFLLFPLVNFYILFNTTYIAKIVRYKCVFKMLKKEMNLNSQRGHLFPRFQSGQLYSSQRIFPEDVQIVPLQPLTPGSTQRLVAASSPVISLLSSHTLARLDIFFPFPQSRAVFLCPDHILAT